MSDVKQIPIRILRVLEYVGPLEQLQKVLEQNAVKGIARFGDITIQEAIVGPRLDLAPPGYFDEEGNPKSTLDEQIAKGARNSGFPDGRG